MSAVEKAIEASKSERRMMVDDVTMAEMAEMQMQGPPNTLPMMGGEGPFGSIAMGGMFTILKVRDNLENYEADPGWSDNPPGTVSGPVDMPGVRSQEESESTQDSSLSTCPMHPGVLEDKPGKCPSDT